MAATDNILAAIAGTLEGARDVIVPFETKKLEQRLQSVPVHRAEAISGIETGLSPTEMLSPLEIGLLKNRTTKSGMDALYNSDGEIVGYVPRGSKQLRETMETPDAKLSRQKELESFKAGLKTDTKEAEKEGEKGIAQKRVSEILKDMQGQYAQLSSQGAIVDTSKGAVKNLGAAIKSSKVGQATGGVFGTESQSIRQKIRNTQPLLIQEIRKASQMGARGLDSEKELMFYLQAATDPSKDIQSNLNALKVLDGAYGLGTLKDDTQDEGSVATGSNALPKVGETFQGGTVTKVRRIR